MPQNNILDRVRLVMQKQPLQKSIEESIRWYRNKIRELSGFAGDSHYSRGSGLRKEMLSDASRSRSQYFPGRLYLFCYDPKLKKTLPFYDRFPLVFFIGPCSDGTLMGINFHYLGYRQRLLLFHELATLATNKLTDERTKLQLSYKMLKGMARFKAFKPCFHKYLPQHITSNLVKIDAPDWEISLFLPVENFAKKSKTAVWNHSDEIISGNKSTIGNTGLPKNSQRTSTASKVAPSNGAPTKS
jgi:hypothetical protein